MEATVVVVGLGDLGSRVLQILAGMPGIERLVGAARDEARAAEVAQAALLARLAGAQTNVSFERVNLEDREGTARSLRRLDPEIVVMAAARQTWWRPAVRNVARAAALETLPYAVWLPLHVTIVRQLMEAWREAGGPGKVVSLPLPDAVGPVLAPSGLAPLVGAGNITEVAVKLALLAERQADGGPEDISVHLVMHHAAERVAFGAFAGLAGAEQVNGEPPWWAEVRAGQERLDDATVDALFHAPYALPPGRASQQLTAGATAHLVSALLSDKPVATHAPAPHGLPGGYPVLVSRSGVQLDLPAVLPAARAIRINRRAECWDGIERIEADGTVRFTERVAEATERILGLRLDVATPSKQAALADELLARAVGG